LALHARRSHASMVRFRERHPNLPLILALVGTDLYGDIHTDSSAQESLELADCFVVLQPMGISELPERMASKARVIYQSVKPPPGEFKPKKNVFEVCVIGHMRPVKDPFRTALAVLSLPSSSRIQVLHAGADLNGDMGETARRETSLNPRYRWLGNLPHWKSMRLLARSRLLSLTSESEGGANVVSEAIACSVPIVSSRISGSIGLLGEDYPGYLTVGDTQELATLLQRTETDAGFYNRLKSWCERLKPLFEPADERRRWDELLREFD
ncbi:MAG: selenoneine biosynthesis selenosugar synthase SenB, partial [Candidatus Poribacteria bacterium]|nr:selenoneine biosynthesis selenosugar synthase SenB [Candidatus Poribacteria bacterium]